MRKVIAIFSCSPILVLRLGGFTFERSLLQFHENEEEELEAFEKLHASLPAMEKRRIQKIDVTAAEALVEEIKAAEPGATQVIDSTVGERASKPKAEGNLNQQMAEQADAAQPPKERGPAAPTLGLSLKKA